MLRPDRLRPLSTRLRSPANVAGSCSPVAGDQPENPRKDHRTDDRYDDGIDHPALRGESQRLHDPSADQRAHNTDHDVHDHAVAAAPHDLARRPSGDEAHNDPPEKMHNSLPN